MPTLFRMFVIIALMGGGFLGFLVYLGSSAEPVRQEVLVDIPLNPAGKGVRSGNP